VCMSMMFGIAVVGIGIVSCAVDIGCRIDG